MFYLLNFYKVYFTIMNIFFYILKFLGFKRFKPGDLIHINKKFNFETDSVVLFSEEFCDRVSNILLSSNFNQNGDLLIKLNSTNEFLFVIEKEIISLNEEFIPWKDKTNKVKVLYKNKFWWVSTKNLIKYKK